MIVIASSRRAARLMALSLGTILASGFAAPVAAQVALPAPVRQSVDANGVDLFLGTMNVDGPVLSVGDGKRHGLTWQKIVRGTNGWGDTLVGTLVISGTTAYVSFGGVTNGFTKSGSTFISTEADGVTLAVSGSNYIYTASDGTVAVFTTNYAGAFPYDRVQGNVVSVTKPDGTVFSYNYSSFYYCSRSKLLSDSEVCTAHNYAYRISSVENSQYKLDVQYGNWDPSTIETNTAYDSLPGWGNITGVAATNNAVTGTSVRSQSFGASLVGGVSYYSVADAMGRVTKYRQVSGSTAVAGITRPGDTSESVTIAYNGTKVATVTNASGTTHYASSDSGNVRTTTVTDALGRATTYTFDIASQRMTSVVDALAYKTSYAYDSYARPTKVTSRELNYTQYAYDTRGNITSTTWVSKTPGTPANIVTSASYPATCTNAATCNKPTWTKDAAGNQTDYTYDATTGDVLTVTQPAPTTGAARPKSTYSYTSVGGVSLLSGSSSCITGASCAGTASEVKTSVAYNSNGLPVSVTRQAGDGSLVATTATTYDAVGNVVSVDGPLAGTVDTTTYRYDADREVVGVISGDPDGAGSLKRRARRVTYNANGQPTVTEVGTVAGVTDTDWSGFASLQQATTTYDAAARPVKTAVTAGGTTYGVSLYSYDAVGRPDCTAVRMNSATWGSATAACTAGTPGADGPDRITRATYDAVGRVIKTTSGYGTADAADTASATYSVNGQVATATDAKGNRTTYSYDGFDRLVKTQYPVPAAGANASSTTDYEQLGYDATGNVVSRRLRDGTSIAYGYDALNRLTSKNLPGSEPDVTYAYDLLGRPTGVSQSGNGLAFGYDALGRLLTQGGPQGTMTSSYDLAGRRTKLAWPDGFYVSYDYDVLGETTKVRENGATTGVGVLGTYAYDDLGHRTSLTRGNGAVTTYAFDPVSRLSSLAQNPAGTTRDLTLGFSYNRASQIASVTRSNDAYAFTDAANTNRAYTTNGLNQYTASGGLPLGYDTRGNLTSSVSGAYTYSSENLLKTGPANTTLAYDPLLRLFQVTQDATTTRFAYDGLDLTAEYNAANALTKRYVHGPGDDEPLVEYEGSGITDRHWLMADERGSVIATTDGTGTASVPNTYDEYGIPGADNTGRFQYTGQTWLPELGMYYYKARIYSPTLGRFMQTDPIGYGDGMNWYNYVGGDPVNFVDPSGNACYSVSNNDGYSINYFNADGDFLGAEIHGNTYSQRCFNDNPGGGSQSQSFGGNGGRPAPPTLGQGTPQNGQELNRRRVMHDCIAGELAAGMEEAGAQVTREVSFSYEGKVARFDIVTSSGGVPNFVYEVKTFSDYATQGSDLLRRNQGPVSVGIRNGGAIPFGPNAAAAGFIPGQPIGRPMTFTVLPVPTVCK